MKVTLPDGTPLDLPDGATGADAAAAIGPGLARVALAIRQDGEVRDLARPLLADRTLEIVTDRSGRDALDLIRHDAAHVLATAVLELYPGVKISIGPPIENGFYYDFDFPDGVSLSDGDFEHIEARMREHVGRVVADEVERGLARALGDDLQRRVGHERAREVADLAVLLDRERGAGEARPDRRGRVGAGGAVGQLDPGAVGELERHRGRC